MCISLFLTLLSACLSLPRLASSFLKRCTFFFHLLYLIFHPYLFKCVCFPFCFVFYVSSFFLFLLALFFLSFPDRYNTLSLHKPAYKMWNVVALHFLKQTVTEKHHLKMGRPAVKVLLCTVSWTVMNFNIIGLRSILTY